MSNLSNCVEIFEDSRRICSQQIDVERINELDNYTKRRKLNDSSAQRQENSSQELSVEDCLSLMFPTDPQNINDLCPEVFQIIISKLSNSNLWRRLLPLRLVCKYWRSNIDSYLSSSHGLQYTGRVSKGMPPPFMNYYEFNAMLSFYPNLRQLIVKNFRVSDHFVEILRQKVPKLELLTLNGGLNLSWKGITYLAIHFPQLKCIDVSNCDLDENRLSILVKNLRNLEVMFAKNPGRQVVGHCLSELGPKIQDLWIGLNHLSNCNPTLKALVSGNGKNLLYLGLNVSNFQATDWSIITDNMKRLKSLVLKFGSFRNSSLKQLAKLKNLENLGLAEDSHNDNESVLTDNSLLPVLRGCSQLKSLAIFGTKPNTCRFTSILIEQIPQLCKYIEQIRFYNTQNINDHCLDHLATIPSLFFLKLSSNKSITDKGVIDFAKKSKCVHDFRISDCPNVTDDIIEVWKQVAISRPEDQIKLFLGEMTITKSLEDLPSNLRIEVKDKNVIETTQKPNKLIT